MVKKPFKILAINPGSKYLGIAVFEGPELRDWCIKVIKGKWSKEKIQKAYEVVISFVGQYECNVLAIKTLHPSRSSRNLNRLVAQIKSLAERKGLRVYQYSIKDLEEFISPERRINKMTLAELITSEYPVLFHELNKEKSHKNAYHLRMFEAVALGAVCFHHLDKR